MKKEPEKTILKPKHQKFAIEYLKHGNITKAAINVGYSEKTAYSIGSELLKKPEIQNFIKEFQTNLLKNANIDLQTIVLQIKSIADKTKNDNTKLRAFDMIMKHLGGYITVNDIISNLTDKQINELIEKLNKRITP
jgi:phage terminase small subunit